MLIFVVLLLFASCKEPPNYNPFDDQFNVSVNQLIKDGCRMEYGECGYINIVNYGRSLNPYYQVHIDDINQVEAKGFEYQIDSFKFSCNLQMGLNDPHLDSLANLPIDIKRLNEELSSYAYRLDLQLGDSLKLVSILDTIILETDVVLSNNGSYLIRKVDFFKTTSKP